MMKLPSFTTGTTIQKTLAPFALLGLVACGVQSEQTPPITDGSADLPAAVREQISTAEKTLVERNLPLELGSVSTELALQSGDEIERLRQSLIDDDAIVPNYNGMDAESFSLDTVAERMQSFNRNGGVNQDVVTNIREMVFPLIEQGARTATLTWESEGQEFTSTLVYNDEGIVYDNILTNLFTVTLEASEGGTPEVSLTEDDTGLQPQATSFSNTCSAATAGWLWGSERGSVTVTHSIIWDGVGTIEDQGISVSHYMSLGSSGGEGAEVTISPTSYAKAAYGWAMVTPTGSFEISYSKSGASFSVSLGGLGSTMGDDGHCFIYV